MHKMGKLTCYFSKVGNSEYFSRKKLCQNKIGRFHLKHPVFHKHAILVKHVTLKRLLITLLCLPDLQEFLAKHDHAGIPMKIYKMKSFTKQITVEVIQQTIKKMNNAIEELQKIHIPAWSCLAFSCFVNARNQFIVKNASNKFEKLFLKLYPVVCGR